MAVKLSIAGALLALGLLAWCSRDPGHAITPGHLELRSRVGMDLGPGYARDHDGYLDPTSYIRAHRPHRNLAR